ncbi:MAG: tetratricopeptide repeat protein, partial [Bacteroidota bacterium]
VNQNLDQHRDATSSFHQILVLDPNFGRAHFELGRSYLNLSEFELSMEHFQDAIRLEENSYSKAYIADIYLHKAEQYQQEDKSILASKAVNQALILLPDMPEAKSLRKSLSGIQEEIQPIQSEERRTADLYFMEGNYKEALKYYRNLKKRTSLADRDLSLKIGKCYLQLEDYNRAILAAQEALFLNSTDPDAMLLKAEGLSAKGGKVQALILIKDIMRNHPESLEALALKTQIHIEEEDYVAASLSIARWEGLESQMGIRQNLERKKLQAKALLGQDKTEEALKEIDDILQIENFNTEFLYLKAKALFVLRSYDESLTFSEAALESQRNYEPALLLKIKTYLKKGSPQLALSSIDELQGVNNKDLFTLAYYKAMANYSLKEYRTAKSWIERALRARRNDFQAVLLHGKILLALEKFLDAGMTLNTAYKLEPNHPEANFELGRYYHLFGARQSEQKRFEDALPYYHKAMELAPELFEEYPDLIDKLKE